MSAFTHIQCHFVRGIINHRLRFGAPHTSLRLDKYRQLAMFEPEQMLGYIRWRANEYGTQDWRLYIVKTSKSGLLTHIPGISPAVKLCCSVNGPKAMKQALSTLDRMENELSAGLESLPESYWLTFKSRLNSEDTSPILPSKFLKTGKIYAV